MKRPTTRAIWMFSLIVGTALFLVGTGFQYHNNGRSPVTKPLWCDGPADGYTTIVVRFGSCSVSFCVPVGDGEMVERELW